MSDFDDLPTLPTINRTVVMEVPKQPFFDWVNALFPNNTPIYAENIKEYSSYLINNELILHEAKNTLRKYWKTIFIEQLNGVSTYAETWPQPSWQLFTQWFDCYFSSMVFDPQDEPLHLESYD